MDESAAAAAGGVRREMGNYLLTFASMTIKTMRVGCWGKKLFNR